MLPSEVVREVTGFDLEGVLSSPDRPDVIQAELIWQQWAAAYGDDETFSWGWTTEAAAQAKQMVKGRARFMAHIEVTDFGSGGLDGAGLARTVAAAVAAGPHGVDLYDAHLLEQVTADSRSLQMAWLPSS